MTSTLQQLITERIQREGPIPFADYMRMALYEPGHGYYVTASARVGWEGDFYTSTDVSNLFAHCMSRQLVQIWEQLERPTPFIVLEQGAGRRHLAQQITAWAAQEQLDFHTALEYDTEDISSGQDAILSNISRATNNRAIHDSDPSAPQYSRGDPCGRPAVGHPAVARPAPVSAFPHVVLSNELVDAFPVHIIEKRDERLYEVFVDIHHGRMHEVLSEPSRAEVATYLDRYKIPWQTFENGWRAEINLDALRWMQRTAQLLRGSPSSTQRKRRGFLLTIDYGDKARALYTKNRPYGTLTCYYQHQLTERPLVRPGAQDITAHVNFSALIDEGRQQGLHLHTFTTQKAWLEGLGIHEELERIRTRDFAIIDKERATDKGQVALFQWYNLRQGVSALTDPMGMGNFKVLIMKR